MSTYKYHASNDATVVALSCDAPVRGWLAPSVGLGAFAVGEAETVMPRQDAMAYLKARAVEGHQVVRGKDISANGLFQLRADIDKNRRPSHK